MLEIGEVVVEVDSLVHCECLLLRVCVFRRAQAACDPDDLFHNSLETRGGGLPVMFESPPCVSPRSPAAQLAACISLI